MNNPAGSTSPRSTFPGLNLSTEMAQCIKACSDCHEICLATVQHCLQLGGEHAGHNHVRALLDCAEACQTGANFMLRGSELHTRTCGVCAEACTRCADSCAQFGDDTLMRSCADLCRRCAGFCRRMAGMHMQHGPAQDAGEPPI